MYAIIKTGGKQYKVAPGDVIRIEKLSAAEGESVTFDQVLMLADGDKLQVGTPLLPGQTVGASVLRHGRGDKIEVIKFRRRKHYRKQTGHRQDYTEVSITNVGGKTAEPRKPFIKKQAPAEGEAAPKKKASADKTAPKKKAAAKKKPTSKKSK
jgi:large subunit ribosomal protein L21